MYKPFFSFMLAITAIKVIELAIRGWDYLDGYVEVVEIRGPASVVWGAALLVISVTVTLGVWLDARVAAVSSFLAGTCFVTFGTIVLQDNWAIFPEAIRQSVAYLAMGGVWYVLGVFWHLHHQVVTSRGAPGGGSSATA